jgi:hypothetical protein
VSTTHAKSFDPVEHATVLTKIAAFGIDPTVVKFIPVTPSTASENRTCLFIVYNTVNGSTHQGTWPGRYGFQILHYNITINLATFKFVNCSVTVTFIVSDLCHCNTEIALVWTCHTNNLCFQFIQFHSGTDAGHYSVHAFFRSRSLSRFTHVSAAVF